MKLKEKISTFLLEPIKISRLQFYLIIVSISSNDAL